jgi:hypothetical protein
MIPLLRVVGIGVLLGGLLLIGAACGGGETSEEAGADASDSLDQAPAAQTSPDMPADPVDSLSQAQRDRLGPALQRFLTGDARATGDVKAVGTRDGQDVFSVIIRSENADALRQAGLPLTSVTGTTITARLTMDEIQKAASVEAVQSVRSDRQMEPHSPSGPKERPGSTSPSPGGEPPAGSGTPATGGGSSP